MKDDICTQRQVKSLYCAANKFRSTFAQCSNALKNTLFRAYCVLICSIPANCGAARYTQCRQCHCVA